MENNFEALLDESSDEDHALSDDSNYISDRSEITDVDDKIVDNLQILALNGHTKVCTIYFYYSTGGALALCTSCMISIQDVGLMYAVRKHVIELHDVVDSRFCANCRNPVYIIFPCNMCPICTHL